MSTHPARDLRIDGDLGSLLAPQARLETIAEGGQWFEGPAWMGETLIWSDVVGNRLHSWTREAGAQVWLEPSHHQNGHTVDHEGRLIAASHGERAVVRREADGQWVILADLVGGRRFHSPNDLVVASDGGIWFTDPRYGLEKPEEGYGGEAELEGNHVYRVGPEGLRGEPLAVTPAMPAPNGLAFSPDESVLYVADSHEQVLWGFPVHVLGADASLGQAWEVARVPGAPDGLRVDPTGRLWVSSGEGVQVFAPPSRGEVATWLGAIRTESVCSNLAFSPDHGLLAMTVDSRVQLVALGDVTR